MVGDEFVDQLDQFGQLAGSREQHLFFGGEMDIDFLLEMLLDLRLPAFKIRVGDGLGAIDAHT